MRPSLRELTKARRDPSSKTISHFVNRGGHCLSSMTILGAWGGAQCQRCERGRDARPHTACSSMAPAP